jgi:hypothetical protein
MKHILATRVNFSNDDKFKNYFQVMKKTYIPSINSQINKNFIIGLSVNPKHYDLIRDLIDDKIDIIIFNDVKDSYKNYIIENKINLQTRHDCDDYMSPNYIDFLQNIANDKSKTLDDFIVTLQPTKLDFKTGKEYLHERDYSKICSMFSTLYQKNPKDGIYDVVHDHLRRLSRNVYYIKENYVKLTIHENNIHSKFNGKQPIE